MQKLMKPGNWVLGIVALLILGVGGIAILQPNSDTPQNSVKSPTPTETGLVREADVPALPFPDNPDPTQCGIPAVWGSANNQAWLNGLYEGEMVQPVVFLYDSHLRYKIVAQAPHGTEVQIILFQGNPVLDYYLIRIPGAPVGQNEGWIPAPFLSFAPEVFG